MTIPYTGQPTYHNGHSVAFSSIATTLNAYNENSVLFHQKRKLTCTESLCTVETYYDYVRRDGSSETSENQVFQVQLAPFPVATWPALT